MAKTIQQRVTAALAASDKARKAAEYKAGESARRSSAARMAADTRADKRLDGLLSGAVAPRSVKDFEILDRQMTEDL